MIITEQDYWYVTAFYIVYEVSPDGESKVI